MTLRDLHVDRRDGAKRAMITAARIVAISRNDKLSVPNMIALCLTVQGVLDADGLQTGKGE